MSIALRNERAGIAGITGAVDWHFMGHAGDPFGGRTRLPDLPVRLMARQIEVMHTMGNHWDNFAAIDAQPQMYQQERRRLEDFVHFAPAHTRTQQLIVPEDTVDDLMARIIEMQQGPRIERIRQEIAEGEKVRFTDRQKFHAQIISLAA
ncbi:hypothetical protein J1C56_02445 [Aminobacter anthyllidis]|uniref:Uncharacterized protein n=1 Tax=Aminobacter anthyllidis TaxID=1035067 RepID=A0A9X1D476_9HYPH|nr:hypothetical protein [Aminobacter anthyllidis]MBT1154444.1 hypothetical protein [Aminobacter anthyllidis]